MILKSVFRWNSPVFWGIVLAVSSTVSGCAYRLVPGPLKPLSETEHGENVSVADDGTVTHHIARFRVSLRPMTDEEMNRQFSQYSAARENSLNPYTYGDWIPAGETRTPARYTIFYLKVENYSYPKVLVSPLNMTLSSGNGRTYPSRSVSYLKEYYYPFNIAYAGISSSHFSERVGLLKRTMYPESQMVFSGQEAEGFVVFAKLHDDVHNVSVDLKDIVLRFDFRDEPTETRDLVFHFAREVAREQ